MASLLAWLKPETQSKLKRVARAIQVHLDRLQMQSDLGVRGECDRLREELTRAEVVGGTEISDDTIYQSVAIAAEGVRRVLGKTLHAEQLYGACGLAQGRIIEMQTGEGKTLTGVPAAVSFALRGRGVHVATPNDYLAKRDCDLLRGVYEFLGMTAGLLQDRASPQEKRQAYQADVTYGTGYEFGFDFLRDQVILRQQTQQGLGDSILEKLRGSGDNGAVLMQRGHSYAIIDEADHVLLDDAISPLVLSSAPQGEAHDAPVVRLARDVACRLHAGVDYEGGGGSGVRLTARGREHVYSADIAIPTDRLRRTWSEYIEQALVAAWLLQRDVHYVVDGDALQIVETATGRIFADRTWRAGLHQAVEAKEGLRITAEKEILAQVTRQRYYRRYEKLSGMTGTAGGCEREFRYVYGLGVQEIPLRLPSKRLLLPMRCFISREAKWQAIAASVGEFHRSGRPVLVGTRSIVDSLRLAETLSSLGLPYQLLNGRQDAEEAEIVSRAGKIGAITVATNLAGRGTDILLPEEVERQGGLHVIVAEPHDSMRVDRQLIGRCARQGNRGSAQTFVSAEDELLVLHGPWFSEPLRKMANTKGEIELPLESRVRRLQRVAERKQYAIRAALLRQDLARDSLVSRMRNGN